MDDRTIRHHYTVEIGRQTKNGQRQVQVFKKQVDPATKVPVGDPVVVDADDSVTLDLLVDLLPELSVDDSLRVSGGDDSDQ
jgi:hypothetical protein